MDSILTPESNEQIRELFTNPEYRRMKETFSRVILSNLKFYNSPECSSELITAVEDGVKRGLYDNELYDELHTLVHTKLFPKCAENEKSDFRRDLNRVEQIEPILRKYLDENKVDSYLDVGCNEGSITAAVGDLLGAREVKGCDVVRTKDNYDFDFTLLDPDDPFTLPYPDKSQDVVSAFMSLHHMEELDTMLGEINRVLKDDGVFFIREHDASPKRLSLMLDLMHGFYAMVWNEEQEMKDFTEHFAKYYSRSDLTKLIEGDNRFKNVHLSDIRGAWKYYYAVYVKSPEMSSPEISRKMSKYFQEETLTVEEEEEAIKTAYTLVRNHESYYLPIERAYRSPAIDAIPYFAVTKQIYHGMGYFKARQLYFKAFGRKKGPKTAFFNAEMPGGFIKAALDIWPDLEWRASSFFPREDLMTLDINNPTVRGRTSDGFSFLRDKFGTFENNKERWMIGDMTFGDMKVWLDGDLTNAKSLALLIALSKSKGLVDLYTADGGFETEGDKEDNENMFKLFIGEMLTGTACLAPGGTLIVKTFGGLHPITHYVVATCKKFFNKINLHKPFMSRKTNMEFYVILRDRNEEPLNLSLKEIQEFLDISLMSNTERGQNEFEDVYPDNLPFLPEPSESDMKKINRYALQLKQNRFAARQQLLDIGLEHTKTFNEAKQLITDRLVRKTADDYLESIGLPRTGKFPSYVTDGR